MTVKGLADIKINANIWPEHYFQHSSFCAVPFCIFQITADEQHSGEISPVGDQCESAVGDQGKSD